MQSISLKTKTTLCAIAVLLMTSLAFPVQAKPKPDSDFAAIILDWLCPILGCGVQDDPIIDPQRNDTNQ